MNNGNMLSFAEHMAAEKGPALLFVAFDVCYSSAPHLSVDNSHDWSGVSVVVHIAYNCFKTECNNVCCTVRANFGPRQESK